MTTMQRRFNPPNRTECAQCGRRVSILPSGKLRAHNDGTHGPAQAPRRCAGSGTGATEGAES